MSDTLEAATAIRKTEQRFSPRWRRATHDIRRPTQPLLPMPVISTRPVHASRWSTNEAAALTSIPTCPSPATAGQSDRTQGLGYEGVGLVTIWLTQAVSERMDAANACMLGASLADACPLLPSGRQQAPPSGGAPAAPTPHLESSAAGSRGRESPQRGASRLKAIESGASPAYQLVGPRPQILNNARLQGQATTAHPRWGRWR